MLASSDDGVGLAGAVASKALDARSAGATEPTLTLEQLVALLMCRDGAPELAVLNPHLGKAGASAVLQAWHGLGGSGLGGERSGGS